MPVGFRDVESRAGVAGGVVPADAATRLCDVCARVSPCESSDGREGHGHSWQGKDLRRPSKRNVTSDSGNARCRTVAHRINKLYADEVVSVQSDNAFRYTIARSNVPARPLPKRKEVGRCTDTTSCEVVESVTAYWRCTGSDCSR